jgi:hypothetical protein
MRIVHLATAPKLVESVPSGSCFLKLNITQVKLPAHAKELTQQLWQAVEQATNTSFRSSSSNEK